MTEAFDPEELRIVSDILALVLDEQAGQAAGALETIRARARRNRLTGGALKNLFTALGRDTTRMDQRKHIKQIEQERDRLAGEIARANKRVRILQGQLVQSQRDSQALLSEAALSRSQQHWRQAATGAALVVGILLGTAGSAIYHALTAPPTCDRASYLR